MLRGYLVVDEQGRDRRRVPIHDRVVVGRASTCDVSIEDSAASRQHLSVETREGWFFWKDLGSTNGTLVNGTPMLEGQLHPGDRMQIGSTIVRLDVREESEEGRDAQGTPLFLSLIHISEPTRPY